MEAIKIVEYSEQYKADFKNLNLEWIEEFFIVEQSDKFVLENPQESIIDKGGFIYFATIKNEIVGTFALMKVDNETYELAKMAVNRKYQNNGIGKRLLDFAIDKAKHLNSKKLILYTNSNLQTAFNMYIKYGFKEIPKKDFHNNRADIKMEMIL